MLAQVKKVVFAFALLYFSYPAFASVPTHVSVQIVNHHSSDIHTAAEGLPSALAGHSRSALSTINIPAKITYTSYKWNHGCAFDISTLVSRVVVDSYPLDASDACNGYVNEDGILILVVE